MRRILRLAAAVAAMLVVARTAYAQGLSDSERKAAARAAYTEGVKLQDDGKASDALARFEAAQKLYDAPTHLLHIAECQVLTGKLVEAAETYETLVHKNLGASPPEAFQEAQDRAKLELPTIRARIPTLRVTVKPDPATLVNLQVTVNGSLMPNELLTIARPLNPGTYKLTASANGYKLPAPIDLPIAEREAKSIELQLVPGQTPAAVVPVVVPAPLPPPYSASTAPPPVATAGPTENPKPPPPEGPSPTGVLLGARAGLFIPGGGIATGRTGDAIKFESLATTGGGVGIDAMIRVAKILTVGGTLEYAGYAGPSTLQDDLATGVKGESSASSLYYGVTMGLVPNIDRVSFYGDIGLGGRTFSRTLTIGNAKADEKLTGTELEIGAGLMIPAGPIRILPKAALNVGAFGHATSECNAAIVASYTKCLPDGPITDVATHTVFFVGLGLYYHADLGKK